MWAGGVTEVSKKCAKALNRRFSKEEIHVAQRHLENVLRSLLIREMQTPTTVGVITPQLEQVLPESKKMANAGHCWRECNLENGVGLPQKTTDRPTL